METLEERFWKYVDKADGCWNWSGTKRPDGYGVLGAGGRSAGLVRAHRLSWRLHNGEIPNGMFVCHHCDNPGCVNPVHLFLGSAKENNADMRLKGRGSNPPKQCGSRNYRRQNPPHGESNPASKVTWEIVAEIRALYASGMTAPALAKMVGLSRGQTWQIVTNKAWKAVVP